MLSTESVSGGGHRPRIAIVDDEAGLRRSLQLLLQGHGYDVRAFASGVSMLASPAARNAACVIVDDHMPGLDGLEILRSLRADSWGGAAVLITADNSDDLAARAAWVGFDKVVERPFSHSLLIGTIGQLLRGLANPHEAGG